MTPCISNSSQTQKQRGQDIHFETDISFFVAHLIALIFYNLGLGNVGRWVGLLRNTGSRKIKLIWLFLTLTNPSGKEIL